MSDRTSREIRNRAAELLEARGWAPGRNEADGPMAANWAVAIASGEDLDHGPAMDGPYLTTVSEIETAFESGSLLDWELEQGRTTEQVLALLRADAVPPRVVPPQEARRRQRTQERRQAAMGREADARRQMRARSGPIYDLQRERTKAVSVAYQAAGKPRKVIKMGWSSPNPTYVHPVGHGANRRFEPATQEEWRAWWDWMGERERVRRSVGKVSGRPVEAAEADDG